MTGPVLGACPHVVDLAAGPACAGNALLSSLVQVRGVSFHYFQYAHRSGYRSGTCRHKVLSHELLLLLFAGLSADITGYFFVRDT